MRQLFAVRQERDRAAYSGVNQTKFVTQSDDALKLYSEAYCRERQKLENGKKNKLIELRSYWGLCVEVAQIEMTEAHLPARLPHFNWSKEQWEKHHEKIWQEHVDELLRQKEEQKRLREQSKNQRAQFANA